MRLVTVTRTIDAPIGEVWAITSSFGTIKPWMKGIGTVSVTGAGIGAVRSIQSGFGAVHETLIHIDPENHSVRYAIGGEGLEDWAGFSGGTDLHAVSPDRTRIEWVAEADSAPGDTSAMEAGLRDFMEAGIAGLARLIGAKVE